MLHDLTQKVAAFFNEDMSAANNSEYSKGPQSSNHYIRELLAYRYFDDVSELFVNRNSLGFGVELSTLTGANDDLVKAIANLLKEKVPHEVEVMFLTWGSDRIGKRLDYFTKARSGGGEIFEVLANNRCKFLGQGAHEALIPGEPLLMRDVRAFCFVSMKAKFNNAFVRKLSEVRSSIESFCDNRSIGLSRLVPGHLLGLLRATFIPSTSALETDSHYSDLQALDEQVSESGSMLKVFKDHLEIETSEGEFDVMTLACRKLPETYALWEMSETLGQLFDAKSNIPCPFMMCLTFKFMPDGKSQAMAESKYKHRDRDANSVMSKKFSSLGREAQEWRIVRDRLKDERFAKCFFHTTLFCPKGEGARFSEQVADLYRKCGFEMAGVKYLQLQTFMATLPFTVSEGLFDDLNMAGRLKPMLSFNVANLLPIVADWKGIDTPAMSFLSRRGQVAFWHPHSDVVSNYNMVIAAGSGAGKSFWMQEYIVGMLAQNSKVWMIDVGYSYVKICRLLGGQYLDFGGEYQPCINPFTHISDIDESMQQLVQILSIMARTKEDTTDEEERYIEDAIKAAWNTKKQATRIDDIIEHLSTQASKVAQNLAFLLKKYGSEGRYGKYFNGDSTLDFGKSQFIVLELEKLNQMKDLRSVVLSILIFKISEEMYNGDRTTFKSCGIDEAWDLFSDNLKAVLRFIEHTARRIRKYKGNLVTIAQSITDFHNNPVAQVCLANSEWKIMLKHNDATQVVENRYLDLNPFQERMFRSLQSTPYYSEFLIIGGSNIFYPGRLLVDPFTRICYSTKGSEFARVQELKDKGMSEIGAIAAVTHEVYGISQGDYSNETL